MVRGDYRWLDSERGNPGPYGSNPIGVYTAVDRVSRGFDTHHQGSLQARFPWGRLLSGRIQQRLQVTYADLDNRFHSSFGDSFFETRRTTARAQTDFVATASTGVSFGVEGLAERARGTYFTGEHVAAGADRAPHDRRVRRGPATGGRTRLADGGRARRLDSTRRARRRPLRLHASSGVRRRHGELGQSSRLGDSRSLGRTRAARRARSCASAPAQASGRRTPSRSRSPTTRRSSPSAAAASTSASVSRGDRGLTADATLFFNRYDDLDRRRRRLADRSQPLPHRQHLERAGARPRARPRMARAAGRERSRQLHVPRHGSAGRRSTPGAAPPPFTVGDPLLRRPRHQGSLDLLWTRNALSAFAEVRARGEVLDVEPSFGAFGGLFESAGFTVVDVGRVVAFRPRHRGLRARAEPSRSAVRRVPRLSRSGSPWRRRSPRCCPPVTSRSPMPPGAAGPHRGRPCATCRLTSGPARSSACWARTAPGRRPCSSCWADCSRRMPGR